MDRAGDVTRSPRRTGIIIAVTPSLPVAAGGKDLSDGLHDGGADAASGREE